MTVAMIRAGQQGCLPRASVKPRRLLSSTDHAFHFRRAVHTCGVINHLGVLLAEFTRQESFLSLSSRRRNIPWL